tara:strand:- start:379 stop:1056 length:678 start_codon:yes stop_codon:yes gene_type:complete
MITFDILTIFPELFDPFQKESLLFKAQRKKLLKIQAHDLRSWAKDKHKTVDEKPFGGGLGMVMKVEPVYKAVVKVKKSRGKTKTILFTPRGKKFTQAMAHDLSKLNQIILICGRYEGVDERIAKHVADMEVSLGDFVLMGGEIAAMATIETVSRLIPGVIGKPQFLKERLSKGRRKGFLEYPQYTRPEVFEPKRGVQWRVPKVLLSGNHKKIEQWKAKHRRMIAE